jgi:hypothetical protein
VHDLHSLGTIRALLFDGLGAQRTLFDDDTPNR